MSETAATKIWRPRVVAWRTSGLTAGEFAARHGWIEGTLRHWAWRLGKAGLPTVRFAKVASMPATHRSLAIDLGDRGRVVIEGEIDRELLTMVIELLDARRP